MEFYIEKVYCNLKKLFSTKCVSTSKKDTLFSFREKSLYSVYFLVFNQNIEINRKLFKKLTFGVKSYFFFRKRYGFLLKVVNLRKTLTKGSFMRF